MSVHHIAPYSSWRKPSILVYLAIVLALGSAATMLLGGLGSRWDWWHFRTGLAILKYGAFAAVASVVFSLFAALVTYAGAGIRGRGLAWVAIAISLAAATPPLKAYSTVRSVPPIHDITTDTDNPPEFEAAKALRAPSDNPLDYAGAAIARQQFEAYPDIQPLILRLPADRVFTATENVVKAQGWQITAIERAGGRIEAVDTTKLFGFKDDIVIRVAPQAGGTRVDVRSASRVGKSDVGENAKRIRKFLDDLSLKVSAATDRT